MSNKLEDRPLLSMAAYLGAVCRYAGMRRLILLMALIAASAALEGVGLLLLVPLLGIISGTGSAYLQWVAWLGLTPRLPMLLILFVALVALRAVAIRLRDIKLLQLRLDFVDSLRQELQAALAGAQWHYLCRLQHSDVLHVLGSDLGRVSQGTHFLTQGVASLGMGLVGIVVAFTLSPLMTVVALAIALMLAIGLRRQLGRSLALGQQLSEANRNFFGTASDFLGGLKLIKASSAEAMHVAEFAHRAAALSEKLIGFARSQSNTRAQFEVGAAALLALLLFGAVTALAMPIAELLPIVLVFSRLFPMAKEWNNQLQQLLHALPAFDNARDWLRKCQQAAEFEPGSASNQVIALKSGLVLQGVSFSYRDHGSATLIDISLHIPARQTLAVVGPSGAGKTTLGDIVLGLLPPDRGTMVIDGQKLTSDRQALWRRSVGYVPQDAFLFPLSIRANLQWPNHQMSDEELWQTLKLVAADDFVRAMPRQLDTLVGERGIQISGGERQRLALARALLTQPQLLVLDEATAHLDSENEQKIMETLSRLHGRTTLLVIAHRPSTIRHADQIVVLDKGRVVQLGTWGNLAAQEGLFKKLLIEHKADWIA